MRKDVKFGLTLGAILVATLVAFSLVLWRANKTAPNQPIADDKPVASSDDSSTATGGNSPSGSSDSTAGQTGNSDSTASSGTSSGNSNSIADTTPVAQEPHAVATDSPTTKPAATVDLWSTALNKGVPAIPSQALAAQRGSTGAGNSASASQEPMVTSAPSNSSDQSVAMIDGATTRPVNLQSARASAPTIEPLVPLLAARADSIDASSSVTQANPTPISPITTGATTSAKAQRTHRVVAGETLSSIARAAYGRAGLYVKILSANPGLNPSHLRVGQVLVIPAIAGTNVAASDSAASGAATNSSRSQATDPSTSYRVVAGDTLERIARKLYGDGAMKDKLYDANRGLIGPDENRLRVGWVLKLPVAPTAGR